ncbi:MAG: acetate--CoA ligase family protein [Xanthobacteraceae bacterium]
MDLELSREKVAALTAPRNAVLVGASDRPGSWAAKVWENLNTYEFPGPIYLINPRRTEIWGRPCYADFSALPEKPDHMVIMVPAAGVIDALKSGAAAGARSATVFSAGFGEGFNTEAAALGRELVDAIAKTGLAVSGPNCMGNVCSKSRLVTLTEDRPLTVRPGPVALVGQSGGMMIYSNQALLERGIAPGYLITSGNEAGLSLADYIAFFAGEPEIKVIIIYIEAISDVAKFKAACRLARASGKSVVAIKLGLSEAGRNAALAHTGSLAGTVEAFDAIAGEAGVIRAETLDDAVEITELLVHTGAPTGRRLGAVTLSGAFRGMLLDAAERYGLEFQPLAPETTERLNAVLTVGSLVSNPIDGGFGVLSSADNFMASIDALHNDPNVDMVIVQEGPPRAPGSDRSEHYIRLANDYAATATKPIAFMSPITLGQTDYSREVRAKAPNISFLQEAYKGLRAIATVARRAEREQLAGDEPADSAPPASIQRTIIERVRSRAQAEPVALDEAESKNVLRAYGITTPAETLVTSPSAALKAADRIGYPVVLKAVAPTLLHKSEVGGVALNLATPEQLVHAYDEMTRRLSDHDLTGMLVCQQIRGGAELVLGLHRDREMGLVVMVGSGGVLLELIKDVNFCAPPVSREKARDMLARMRGAKLLEGYRGGAGLDVEAVVDAIVALGRLAVDLEDVVQSVDVNPFVALPRGGLALDALIVLQQSAPRSGGPSA